MVANEIGSFSVRPYLPLGATPVPTADRAQPGSGRHRGNRRLAGIGWSGVLAGIEAHLRLHPDDFSGWSRAARFYPLLYMMTRVCKAKDWVTGVELSAYLLGHLSRLQIHHIFPKAPLYKQGYRKAEVNAIANFTFLTQETNLAISNRNPLEYLEEYAANFPVVVEWHRVPMDR